ncbi:MAG: EAL domain-containing protein [Gammaproteobacteria bacterium]|nr:EAL domain-containing protein [Gammaproteobacteria bacterium]
MFILSIGQARQGFDAQVDELYGLLSQRLASSEAALNSFAGIYQASHGLSGNELTLISTRLRESYPQVLMTMYAAAITEAEVPEFEQEMRGLGFPEFAIHGGGELARPTDPHLALSFVDEMTPTSVQLLGADLAAAPELSLALAQAIDDAAVVAVVTNRFTGTKKWVLAKSVYFGNFVPDSTADRRRQLQGVFLFVLDLNALMSVGEQRYGQLGWRLVTTSALESEAGYTLFERPIPDVALSGAVGARSFSAERIFRVGQQSLGLEVVARPALLGLYMRAGATMLILAILAFAVIVAMRSRRLARLEQEQAREALFLEREKAEVTLKSIADAVMTVDTDCRIVYLNPVARDLIGHADESVEGQSLEDVIEVLDPVTGASELNLEGGCLDCLSAGPSYLLRCRDGREIHVKFSISELRDAQGELAGAVYALHDVSREWALTKKLVYQARHDQLTGLPNRNEFEARLRDALIESHTTDKTHAVFYLDLDQFKLVNDTCGHMVGDRLLKQVSDRLRTVIRGEDIVARLGGDEFGVLLYHCDVEHAAETGERLCKEIAEFRFTHDGKAFGLGVSIGAVMLNSDSGTLAEVLSAADMACYAAKDRGRSCVHMYRADDQVIARRHREMQWSGRLRTALEEDELTLCLQKIAPIAAAPGDRSSQTGLSEFLLRLPDEDGELALPMAFIPAAERYDLMPRIDRWVVRNAFRAIRELRGDNPDALYSINLSGQSMGEPDLAEFVIEQLERERISASNVCFEITETAAISNLSEAVRFVECLRAVGCRFALDDFGAGVSSFGYLKHLAPDFLKIDGQFVRGIAHDPVDRALLETIANIGKVLGIKTIAEWVEDEETLDMLKEFGIDYAQGFHIEEPQPVAAPEPRLLSAVG